MARKPRGFPLTLKIAETSLEGKYLDVSEEFCRMLGYEKDEMLQRGIREVTHDKGYLVDIKLHGQLAAGETPYYKMERCFVRKDSQVICSFSVLPILFSSSLVHVVVCFSLFGVCSSQVLFVTDLFHPVHRSAIELFLNGNVRHGRG